MFLGIFRGKVSLGIFRTCFYKRIDRWVYVQKHIDRCISRRKIYNDIEISSGNKKNLSNTERWAIYNALLERSHDGNLKKILLEKSKETSSGEAVNVCHKKSGNCGRKKIPLNLNQVKSIPFHKRTSLRSLSKSLGIATSTLHKRVKEGMLRHHTNAIKPSLKDGNIRDRLKFCFSMLEKDSLIHEQNSPICTTSHILTKKWFYMTKKMEKYYLVPDEEVPHRTCQSKNYIEKVMFLAAMARPRFDEEGNETFSGKIGVFPFVSMQPAKRRSKNRDAGTLELKASTSVKREDIRACLIEKVIPVIHERWPVEDRGKTIFIQQDNARTHHETCPRTVADLVHVVEESFEEYAAEKVNYIFLTLQSCMKEIMKTGGDNKYKIPHMKKATLDRENRLPLQISCDVSLVQSVMATLASS
ncbi:hypothetical protein Bca52824_059398 [Brassica carinata]|uniref:DUF7769 domain-containing protein n=1 Tax=Brassica carinata TaxID=52824 RepID=A0A8X7QZK0_BRACI|nr:hypothetical protein Bca52824_059398 [Brassica carinata]